MSHMSDLGETPLTPFRCPECGLLMSRMKTVKNGEHWTDWCCWACPHTFGGMSDRGNLDLGLIRVEPEGGNDLGVFVEESMATLEEK